MNSSIKLTVEEDHLQSCITPFSLVYSSHCEGYFNCSMYVYCIPYEWIIGSEITIGRAHSDLIHLYFIQDLSYNINYKL